jgi:hypothetical protein
VRSASSPQRLSGASATRQTRWSLAGGRPGRSVRSEICCATRPSRMFERPKRSASSFIVWGERVAVFVFLLSQAPRAPPAPAHHIELQLPAPPRDPGETLARPCGRSDTRRPQKGSRERDVACILDYHQYTTCVCGATTLLRHAIQVASQVRVHSAKHELTINMSYNSTLYTDCAHAAWCTR